MSTNPASGSEEKSNGAATGANQVATKGSLVIDTVLDRTVAPGFSKIGYAVRKRLPTWPSDPASSALKGKVAIVTGSSSGLGIETARELGRLGGDIHLVVRNKDKGEDVAQDLRSRVPEAAGFTVWRCDLSDLDDVAHLAQELTQKLRRLDVLIHNAGTMPPMRTLSPQGHELSMAVHVLGPVLLTDRLMPTLRTPETPSRVIFVTSGGMYTQPLPTDDPDYLTGDYKGAVAYARSKRTQVDLLPAMAHRWEPARVYAMHPGWADSPGVKTSMPTFRKVTASILRDMQEGADTTVWLSAVQPAPPTSTFWHDREVRPTNMLPTTRSSVAERARMWDWVLNNSKIGA